MAPKNTIATETAAPAAVKAFTVLGVSSAVTMPEHIAKRRGSQTQFPFAVLEPGQSFGLIGRNAKSMASIVSNQNRAESNQTNKLDANGAPIFKTKTVKDANGAETVIPTTETEKVWIKEFIAVDVDPATDPEGATVRVFRKR